MTSFEPTGVLVTLTVAPAIEEALIDWLLSRAEGAGFTSMPVSGHSARHRGLSPAELVTGRQRRIQFQVHMPVEALEDFLTAARAAFGGTDVHYWVTPIFGGARLGAFEAQ